LIERKRNNIIGASKIDLISGCKIEKPIFFGRHTLIVSDTVDRPIGIPITL